MRAQMAKRRWQAPPMESQQDSKKVTTVDERVVRKMLAVNPSVRQGRTTQQVKKSLERGDSVAAPSNEAAPPKAGNAGTELDETVSFFVRGKEQKLATSLAEIEARRKALAEEEASLRAELKNQLVSFIALLDEATVAAHGKKALASHTEFLESLGLTPATLLEKVRKG